MSFLKMMGVAISATEQCIAQALGRYLDNAMYVSLNNGATYNQLPTGVTATGNTTTNFNIYAAQNVTQNDVNQGAGSYYIVVQLTASVTP